MATSSEGAMNDDSPMPLDVAAASKQLKLAVAEASKINAQQRNLFGQVLSLEQRLASCLKSVSGEMVPIATPPPAPGSENGRPPESEVPLELTAREVTAAGCIAAGQLEPGARPNASEMPDVGQLEPNASSSLPDDTGRHLGTSKAVRLEPSLLVPELAVKHANVATLTTTKTHQLDTIFDILPENAATSRARRKLTAVLRGLVEPERKGVLARCVRSKQFELLCVSVIVFNAVFAAFVSDYEMRLIKEAQPSPGRIDAQSSLVQQVEVALLAFYVAELLMKGLVHGRFLFVCSEWRWNAFDCVLVMFSAFDTAVAKVVEDGEGTNMSFMRIFRLLRLSKVLRVFRAFRLFTELRLMLNALAHSFVTLYWAMAMLLIILFVMALVFVQGSANYLKEEGHTLSDQTFNEFMSHFGSVFDTMISLYKAMTGGDDWGIYFDLLARVGTFYATVFLSYTAFFCFALFNILTGMVVENVVKAASRDDEMRVFDFRRRKREDCRDLARLFNQLDSSHRGKITAAELERGLNIEPVQVMMEKVELDPKDTELFFAMLSSVSENGEVDVNAFVDGCMHLRGPAAGIDLQAVLFEMRGMSKQVRSLRRTVDTLGHMDALARGSCPATSAAAILRTEGHLRSAPP